jgi:hypothetical protein
MKLRDFISGSLMEIASGVVDAINQAEKEGIPLRINPIFQDQEKDWDKYVQVVEFDVAVTASNSEHGDGKLDINVFGLSLGGGAGITKEAISVNRLKVGVPVLMPAHPTIARR